MLLMIDWAVCRPAGDIDFHGISRMASSRAARLDVASDPVGDEAARELSPPVCLFEVGAAAFALAASKTIKAHARQQRMLIAGRALKGASPLILCSSPVIDVPPFRHIRTSRCQQGAQRVNLCRSHKFFRFDKHYGERKNSVRLAIARNSDRGSPNFGDLR